jgi:hypothetical protein
MTDKEIIRKLLDGGSLRTLMIPDPSLPSNRPEHIESYDLPHVVVLGDTFWGKSESVHLLHTPDDASQTIPSSDPRRNLLAFCYTNVGKIFCSYAPELLRVSIFPKERYKKHVWQVRENYRLIWDSENDSKTNIVKDEINATSKFKIAMLDAEDIWNIHPIDLPMYESETGTFHLKTSADLYPWMFRNPEHLEAVVADYQTVIGKTGDDGGAPIGQVEDQGFSTFYSLCSDGTYYNFYDISRSTRNRYKRLKVFSDRRL